MLTAIYLDIDGVLADFVMPALLLHGRSDLLVPGAWPKGCYRLEEVLQKTESAFWHPIEQQGAKFWWNLPAYPWCRPLFNIARQHAHEVVLCSKPSLSPHSSYGKHIWINRTFGRNFIDYALTPRKHHFAGPGRVLVDDCEDNIAAWEHAGGIGVLFPQPWNRGEGDITSVVMRLDELAELS